MSADNTEVILFLFYSYLINLSYIVFTSNISRITQAVIIAQLPIGANSLNFRSTATIPETRIQNTNR